MFRIRLNAYFILFFYKNIKKPTKRKEEADHIKHKFYPSFNQNYISCHFFSIIICNL